MNLIGIAVAWMRKEDWPRWLAIDPDFQPNYDHWLKRTEKAIEEAQKAGRLVEKVDVEPDEFLEWSRVNGGQVNSQARATYATMVLAKRHRAAN